MSSRVHAVPDRLIGSLKVGAPLDGHHRLYGVGYYSYGGKKMKRVRISRKYRVWKKIGEGMNIIEIHCMHI